MTLDDNKLVEFILKSIDTRFIFLKFVQLHKLSESEVDRFFKIMKEKSKKNKERYFEYFPFDIQFFERQKSRYDRLFDETNQKKNEFKQTKEELNKMKSDFQRTKIKLDQTEVEFSQA